MAIKSSIMEAIWGAIPPCETTKEYLKKVESQIIVSLKTYTSTIIKRLVTEKYSLGSGVREHILKMSNMTWLCRPYLRNLRPLRLTRTPSLKVWELRSSLLCAFKRRRGLRIHIVILSTT
jgi:hypothetical protein